MGRGVDRSSATNSSRVREVHATSRSITGLNNQDVRDARRSAALGINPSPHFAGNERVSKFAFLISGLITRVLKSEGRASRKTLISLLTLLCAYFICLEYSLDMISCSVVAYSVEWPPYP